MAKVARVQLEPVETGPLVVVVVVAMAVAVAVVRAATRMATREAVPVVANIQRASSASRPATAGPVLLRGPAALGLTAVQDRSC